MLLLQKTKNLLGGDNCKPLSSARVIIIFQHAFPSFHHTQKKHFVLCEQGARFMYLQSLYFLLGLGVFVCYFPKLVAKMSFMMLRLKHI